MDPPRERDPTNALISPGTTTGVQSPVMITPVMITIDDHYWVR